MNRYRGAAVGAFIIGGLLLFAGGLFLIGDRRLLFVPQFELATTFGKVTGLQIGTPVRVAGLDAGEVLAILLPSRPSERFRVQMRVRDDVRGLVRADSVAGIQTDGIVGGAFIQISVGTDDAPAVMDGGTIEGSDPIEFADLIREGRDTFRTVSSEIIDLKGDVSLAIAALTETAGTTNAVIGDVGREVGVLTATGVRVAKDLEGTVQDVRVLVDGVKGGQGTIGQLLTDRALYDRMTAVGREAEGTVRNFREASEQARTAIERFTSPDGTVQQVAQTLRNMLADVQEVTSDLADATEALKRNFLFRGFFRQRGFFDLDTLSREAYRSGALEGRERTALRIWIDAAVLFARDAGGLERLTDEGRRRIDSAMAQLVRYPRDSPLVVEGYAEGTGGETPYLQSVDRAQAVKDHVLARFRRNATLTDIMPMADEATGSPRGDNRWSGVALAMFVRNDALSPP